MKKTVNEFGEQVVTMTLSERGPITEKEINEIRAARKRVHEYDEDCPPIPEAMHKQIRDGIARRNESKQRLVQ